MSTVLSYFFSFVTWFFQYIDFPKKKEKRLHGLMAHADIRLLSEPITRFILLNKANKHFNKPTLLTDEIKAKLLLCFSSEWMTMATGEISCQFKCKLQGKMTQLLFFSVTWLIALYLHRRYIIKKMKTSRRYEVTTSMHKIILRVPLK